jgi:hypothetical protein
MALPLRPRGQTIGGLNLFHDGADPVPAAGQRLAQTLADVAAIGILQQRPATAAPCWPSARGVGGSAVRGPEVQVAAMQPFID